MNAKLSMKYLNWLLIFTVFAVNSTPNLYVLAGLEKPISLSGVPAFLFFDLVTKFPEARILGADIETEKDGSVVYEIQGVLKDGRKFEYDVYENGEVQEIEVEFHEDMVPGAVTKAIQRKFPGFQPTYIEASHSRSMKVIKYEFEGNYEGKKIDIEVSADGSQIEIADK